MGFQTEFMILNDAAHLIKDHPEEFAQKIYDACLGTSFMSKHWSGDFYPDNVSLGLGNHCNPIVVNRSHHADDVRVLISGHNDMTDVSRFSKSYNFTVNRFPEILDSHISILEYKLEELKEMRNRVPVQ